MAENFGPFATGAGAAFSATNWQEFFGALLTSGVFKNAKVNGAAGGDLAVSAGSGLAVNVASGLSWVYGFLYENTAVKAITLTAADPTLARKDYIVVELSVSGAIIQAKALAGTPASSPSPPALTQTNATWQVPLAIVTVAANAVSLTGANILDSRAYAGVSANPATMGQGSGLNADTLDGINSTGFSQTDGSVTRVIAVTGSQPTNSTGSNGDIILWY